MEANADILLRFVRVWLVGWWAGVADLVSHSSKDNRQAHALRGWLVAQDPPLANEIFLDTDSDTGLKPGAKWKSQLVSANSRCEAVICLPDTARPAADRPHQLHGD